MIITLISCISKEEINIEWDWIGTYSLSITNDRKDTFYNHLPLIIEIKHDSLINYSLEFNTSDYGLDSIKKYSYFIEDSTLTVVNDVKTFIHKIDLIDSKELVLLDSNTILNFTKVSDLSEEIQNDQLEGKIFKVLSINEEIVDTFEFINRTTFFLYNSNTSQNPTLLNWKLSNFKGNNILVTNSMVYPPFLLDNSNNEIVLKLEHADDNWLKMIPLENEPKKIQELLQGKWTGFSLVPEKKVFFNFSNDSVTMNDITGDRNIKVSYLKSLTEDFIILPYNYGISDFMIYQIMNLDSNSLTFRRRTQLKGDLLLKKVE